MEAMVGNIVAHVRSLEDLPDHEMEGTDGGGTNLPKELNVEVPALDTEIESLYKAVKSRRSQRTTRLQPPASKDDLDPDKILQRIDREFASKLAGAEDAKSIPDILQSQHPFKTATTGPSPFSQSGG